jgi:4-carboxymuconolactone decarboxylase
MASPASPQRTAGCHRDVTSLPLSTRGAVALRGGAPTAHSCSSGVVAKGCDQSPVATPTNLSDSLYGWENALLATDSARYRVAGTRHFVDVSCAVRGDHAAPLLEHFLASDLLVGPYEDASALHDRSGVAVALHVLVLEGLETHVRTAIREAERGIVDDARSRWEIDADALSTLAGRWRRTRGAPKDRFAHTIRRFLRSFSRTPPRRCLGASGIHRGARLAVMDDHLPDIYRAFRDSFPDVAAALDALAVRVDGAGPLDQRTQRLVKLGMAIASASPGAVRSNVRKALQAGDSADEIRHVAALAITTCGFPTAVAGTEWIEEVLRHQ